jgi:geranylgeranyl diphosphate synthase type I
VAGGADPFVVESFGDYAERVGVAFQIRDDVLDATADAADLGKPTGHDAEMDRPSIVQVTGLSPAEADARARAESDAALAALDAADVGDTDAQGYLRDLAEFVVVRER